MPATQGVAVVLPPLSHTTARHPLRCRVFAQNEKRLHQQRRLFVYLVLLPLRPWLGYFESCGVLAGACRLSKKQPLDHRNGCCREHRTAQQPCPPL